MPDKIYPKTEKICRKCGSKRAIDNFYLDSTTPDGYDRRCKICRKKEDARYHFLNREKRNEASRRYDKSHKTEKKKYNREYYLNHRDYFREYNRKRVESEMRRNRKYYHEHKEYFIEYDRIKRQRMASLPATLTELEWQKILDQHNNRCHYCGQKGSSNNPLEREHKIPVSRQGGYTKENIVPACKRCNSGKYTMTDKEFKKVLVEKAQLQLCF